MLRLGRLQSWLQPGELSRICSQPQEVCSGQNHGSICSYRGGVSFCSLLDAGMVLEWEQSTGLLYAAGDVRHIRVWDTHKEMKIQDIPTGADSCVTCLTSDSADRSLMIAGCGDGTVRMYDRRQPPSSR